MNDTTEGPIPVAEYLGTLIPVNRLTTREIKRLMNIRIDQLTVCKDEPAAQIKSAEFFGEPMVGITVKQHEEYVALRARAAEICSWTRDENLDDDVYNTGCGDDYVWRDGNIEELKFCPSCGRKVEVKP